jgi:geranylgeranyl pyrophosphate synthase
MAFSLDDTLASLAPAVEAALETHFPRGVGALHECMRYATFSGGQRMRPLLCLMSADLCRVSREQALPLAAAVEYLHTASLIYDDLPAMDDASQRRGLPASHRKFSPGVAMLAGLSMVTHAFALMSPFPALVREAASCVGHEGMSAGQAIDLAGGNRDHEHYKKTTALFRLALTAPCAAFGTGRAKLAALRQFGEHLGTAYQLMDDAGDEFKSELCERARHELIEANHALAGLQGDHAAQVLTEYAQRLMTPALTR